ncbi:PAS-domain containing protein [Oceaniglobus roseus]|uniref:PAS-domain containing protein n=1 Tax=Oceaniglobus roseus TaxID=1737570 RepID=UPI000C7F727C|nr:PAS-domain containing protein [Kandeliimicrobium roseum]
MLAHQLATGLLAVAAAAIVAVSVLWVTAWLGPPGPARDRPPRERKEDGTTFLLDRAQIVDMSTSARAMLAFADRPVENRDALCAFLASRFPGLAETLDSIEAFGERNLLSRDATEIATLTRSGDRLRITLCGVDDPVGMTQIDRATLLAIRAELAMLRTTAERVPVLIWRQNPQGAITWVNRAYLDACETHLPDWSQDTWPVPHLFGIPEGAEGGQLPRRIRLETGKEGEALWYLVHVAPVEDGLLVAATDASAMAEAETSLRNVVQSLSKTFADLPIGLAVFIRDRRLELFNPALCDLTRIPAHLLAARPTMSAFFDLLRDRQTMPEPRSYASWLERIGALEGSAADGTLQETWHLPFGRTLRITGRPQIGGALALLFEDISDEMGNARRLRTELEVSHAVIDTNPDAVAVFSANGVMTLGNRAYDALWGLNSREGLDSLDIAAAVKCWAAATAPSPLWEHIMAFVGDSDHRHPFDATARLRDGRSLHCRCEQVAGGATLVTFALEKAGSAGLREATTDEDPGESRRQIGS